MKKPLPCNQKWDSMLPTDGGRLCTGCGKIVIDFREFAWADIEKVHSSNPLPTCGIYDDRQLNFWGKEIPTEKNACAKFVHLSATLFALFQVVPTTMDAQVKTPSAVTTNKQVIEINKSTHSSLKKTITGIVVMQLPDSTKIPLNKAEIIIKCDEAQFDHITTTDSFGRFSIDITEKFQLLPNYFPVFIIHPDFLMKQFTIDKNNLQPLDIILAGVTISEPHVAFFETNYFVYGVDRTGPLSKIKKWWHNKWKK